jgi:2-polyprenyl-3-methyl-5-hydroxy-6-metoxy-1,4-benzoquinol methylase
MAKLKTVSVQEAYTYPRKDLLLFNVEKIKSVLDVGCSTGATGNFLLQVNHKLRLVGLDISPEAVEVAAMSYNAVYVVDLESREALHCLGEEKFDIVLLGDVIEHLRDPETVLKTIKEHLSNKGRIVCSIPNFQFWQAIVTVILGRFPRNKSGIFDETHLRFFTLREAKSLFATTGYKIDRIERNFRLVEYRKLGFLNRLTGILRPILWIASPFFTYQYIFVCSSNSLVNGQAGSLPINQPAST